MNAICPGIVDTDIIREYYGKFDQLAPQRYAEAGIKVLSVGYGCKAPVWLAFRPERNHPQGKFLATEESNTSSRLANLQILVNNLYPETSFCILCEYL